MSQRLHSEFSIGLGKASIKLRPLVLVVEILTLGEFLALRDLNWLYFHSDAILRFSNLVLQGDGLLAPSQQGVETCTQSTYGFA